MNDQVHDGPKSVRVMKPRLRKPRGTKIRKMLPRSGERSFGPAHASRMVDRRYRTDDYTAHDGAYDVPGAFFLRRPLRERCQ